MAPPESKQVSSRVEALDLLRLVAVLGVVVYHYGFRGPTVGDATHVAIPEIAWFAQYGFLGVPAFFVISGFVIAYSAAGRTATGFAIARFSRIYPTFVLCMTLTFLTVLIVGRPDFTTSAGQWIANLFIAAPALHHSYMDSAYWSLVIEVTFYAWVTVLIGVGLFPRRIDLIVLVWLCMSMANELTIDAPFVEKVFLADDAGYFSAGLMIYEFYRGRRDFMLLGILCLSTGVAIFHAVHSLAWLRAHSGTAFDGWIVAAICLSSIIVILLATRIERLPLPTRLVIAAGGMTYPLYLLHQQIGYTIFVRMAPANAKFGVTAIVLGIGFVSWILWRYVEEPMQRAVRSRLAGWATRRGWPSKPKLVAHP
ncbi:MAG: acyltransferase [Proteobacteria bacterium]|nr:acyltransferase [Pseudomonadota bacterium]